LTFRHSTRVIVVVHSHTAGTVDLSEDVIQMSMAKGIKQIGSCGFQLVPRRNYLNLIFPDDVVNVYIDPGDGESGFVRSFFGYVDRIEYMTATGENGETESGFRVACSDFTKVFDRTAIYYNQMLADKTEFVDPAFTLSKLGTALRTQGVQAFGSPADIVENLAHALLGFGAQWSLPPDYKATTIDFNKKTRIQRSLARIPNNIAAKLSNLVGAAPDDTELNSKLIKALKEKPSIDLTANILTNIGQELSYVKQQQVLAELREEHASVYLFLKTLQESDTYTASVLDLLDLNFIEAMTIDGYALHESLWAQQGSLSSMMYAFSHDNVNELFFDLRPVVDHQEFGDTVFGTVYSRKADELGINVEGNKEIGDGSFPSHTAAIRYVPAIVMREYPWSVVQGLDLRGYNLSPSDGKSLGFIPFGPVFAADPEPDGPRLRRVIYDYEKDPGVKKRGLVANPDEYEGISKPAKHLDIVTIHSEEVIDAQIGRSDHDHFNLFSAYATDVSMRNDREVMRDFFPIVTPISIARHGLRVKEINTRFAQYSISQQPNVENKSVSAVNELQVQRNLIRWALLIDHWNQHNIEYLTGTITLRFALT